MTGLISDLSILRYTPAGIPAVEFKLMHESTQNEAGAERQVACEVCCIALGDPAVALSTRMDGCRLKVKGFLAARNMRYRSSLVLHVTDYGE
ncbi:primosomal replication protein N [Parachitinimonas caeni]|uniref:Primosomal replication protein N n=1 Tax=Parachitinimonas caeni TaxID=3031301 RepID=A0ABT7DX70_9NEIS|nr:primosomal replication protein N [Parachitinimonas caeni]